MKLIEILRLVWLNLSANKSKVILTSTGIIVGAATIMLVIAIGTGGRMEVAEQFRNLNAGAIDITYEYQGNSGMGDRNVDGMGGILGRGFMGEMNSAGRLPSGRGMPSFGGMENFIGGGQMQNAENIILSDRDREDLETFVPGVTDTTMTFTTNAVVEGGELDESMNYTIAGVQYNYADICNLDLALGEFLTNENDTYKEKICVLGYHAAKDIFGSVYDAYDGKVYIDNRPYQVAGIMEEVGTVASGISPDDAIFIPYNTGVKYLTSTNVSPTITVIADDVNEVDTVITNIEFVLAESYPNASFTISDAGSKMEAASKSNDTLTILLVCMSVIVFIVGGLGIMNVLFVSVKERTNEIGILKAIGCSKRDILLEFLLEASFISLIGAVLGVMLAIGITPILESFGVRVELSIAGGLLSLVFGVFTGTVFGFYPAYQASNMIPVVALNHE